MNFKNLPIHDGRTNEVSFEVDLALKELCGFSYFQFEEALAKFGNVPGCHQPVLYVISRLVAEGKIKSILEFGSGATSLCFHSLKNKYSCSITTLEEERKWFDIVTKSFNYLEIVPDNYYLTPILYNSNIPEFITQILSNNKYDLFFIDCSSNIRRFIPKIYKPYINNSSILMFDDCEQQIFYEQAVDIFFSLNLKKPKMFLSQSRGISVSDPENKINSVLYKWE